MMGSTRIGVTAGVVIGLAASLYSFGRILGLAGDGTDDSAFVWAAIIGAPAIGCLAGYCAGSAAAFVLRRIARRRV